MSSLRRFLAVLLTPLAITVLFSEPGRAQTHDTPVEDRAERTLEGGHDPAHELITNPIQNVASLHYNKDDHGGTWEPGEHKMPPPFLGQLFNFIAFAWLLGRFAWPSIRRATRERHEEIARALAEGSRLRDEARARLEEYSTKLAGLQSEIDKLVNGIRAEAEAEKARIISEAQHRAERMRLDAEQQIQAEMQQVRSTLEREAVVAAISIAERLLTEKTTDTDQKALADRFLHGLQDAAKGRRSTV